jgi:hypothetical protein
MSTRSHPEEALSPMQGPRGAPPLRHFPNDSVNRFPNDSVNRRGGGRRWRRRRGSVGSGGVGSGRARANRALMPISLWLMPPSGSSLPLSQIQTSTRSSLVAAMDAVAAANNFVSFEPHVTLIGNVGDMTEEDATTRLQLCKGAEVATELTEVTAGVDDATGDAPWNQSAVAVVKETPQLVELQRRALAAFQGEEAAATAPIWAPPLRRPHLSLAYAPTGPPSPALVASFQVPPPFIAAAVAVWSVVPPTCEGASQWREIAKVAL